ncbi:MAG: carbon-nitrogen hydrolase [Patescibacteria group bacterium]
MKNKFVTIAAIQNSASFDLKVNLRKTAYLVERAAKRGAKIICLPELYRTIYFPQYKKVDKDSYAETIPGESTGVFSVLAKKYGVVIIVPVFEKRRTGYFNSAVVIDHIGKLLPTYDKIHIPQDPLFYEKNYFEPGKSGYKIYKTKFGKIAVLICFDQWFPEAARAVALLGAEIIFYPTAIGHIIDNKSFEGDWPNAWETIIRGHSIANSVNVVAINRVGREDRLQFWGQSFITDSFGKVLKRASNFKEEILMVSVDLSLNKKIRNAWGFFRNRRPDTYTRVSKQ